MDALFLISNFFFKNFGCDSFDNEGIHEPLGALHRTPVSGWEDACKRGPRLGGWRLATGPIHVPQLQLIVNGHSSCPTDATHGDAIEIQEEGLSHGVASLLKHSA